MVRQTVARQAHTDVYNITEQITVWSMLNLTTKLIKSINKTRLIVLITQQPVNNRCSYPQANKFPCLDKHYFLGKKNLSYK